MWLYGHILEFNATSYDSAWHKALKGSLEIFQY